jgi:hypothetical protein
LLQAEQQLFWFIVALEANSDAASRHASGAQRWLRPGEDFLNESVATSKLRHCGSRGTEAEAL